MEPVSLPWFRRVGGAGGPVRSRRVPLTAWAILAAFALLGVAPADAQEPPPSPEEETGANARIERVIQSLRESDAFKVRLQAAVVLGRLGDKKAVPALIAALQDEHYTVRGAAAMALGLIGDPQAIQALINVAAFDAEEFVRIEGEKALAGFPRDLARPFVAQSFESDDARVRAVGVRMAARVPDAEARQMLIEALDDQEQIAHAAADAILALGLETATPLLVKALDHARTPVQVRAITLLTQIGGPRAVDALIGMIERDIKITEVNTAARDGLRALRRFIDVNEVMRTLKQPNAERHARARSARLLGVVGGDQALQTLVEVLGDEDVFMRGTAAIALAELGDTRAIEKLDALTQDDANQRILQIVRNSISILKRKGQPMRN